MSRILICPTCDKKFRVDDDTSKRRKCRECGSPLEDPDEVSDEDTPLPRTSAGKKSGKRKGKRASRGVLPYMIGGFVAVGLVMGVVIWFLKGKGDSAPQNEAVAAAKSNAKFTMFDHAAGGFSCELPGTPARQPKMEEPGLEAYYLQDADKNAGYLITSLSLEKRVTNGKTQRFILDVGAKTLAASFPGSTTVERTFSQDQGHETQTIKLKKADGTPLYVRHYFHRDAILEFVIGFEKNESPAEVDRFFRSIRLTP